jgi:hypothetical protein
MRLWRGEELKPIRHGLQDLGLYFAIYPCDVSMQEQRLSDASLAKHGRFSAKDDEDNASKLELVCPCLIV